MAPDLPSRVLRFDARSLGLFRLAFGVALIADLFHRWDWLEAFYSNEGVLPNHNHLFQFQDGGKVWSVYHSFSSLEEVTVAFILTLLAYLCFTVGWHTRAFHAVSLLCLIGLSARNTLAEGPGNSVAIALLFVTLFMPLGARMSLDGLRRSFEEEDEHNPEALNDRTRPAPGVAGPSLAALATLLVLGLILVGAATSQTGATWRDGSALHYALHVDRWTSSVGVALREKAGLLSIWTHVFRYAELAVVPLALIPVARHVTRPIAAALLAFVGLTIGVLFTLGLYGWSLVAAALLLLPEELWDNLKRRRPTTLIYDDDCGICLWCARLIKRLDLRHNFTFQANSDLEALPEGITEEMANRSMVVVGPDGSAHRDADAVSVLVRALPFVGWLGWLLVIPGIHHLMRWLYFKVADNRIEISVALGMGACGVPQKGGDGAEKSAPPPSPAARTKTLFGALVSSAGALFVFSACWAQAEHQGAVPTRFGLGERALLVDVATWSRVLATWSLWAPDPPLENGGLITVAKTRGEFVLDVLTGYPPDEQLQNPRLARRGSLWASYTENIAKAENEPFHKEFRRYLTKGGYAIDTRVPNNYIRNLTVYWVAVPTPAPGATPAEGATPRKEEIFDRSGRVGGPARPKLPIPKVTPE